jgi:hypothetical protein
LATVRSAGTPRAIRDTESRSHGTTFNEDFEFTLAHHPCDKLSFLRSCRPKRRLAETLLAGHILMGVLIVRSWRTKHKTRSSRAGKRVNQLYGSRKDHILVRLKIIPIRQQYLLDEQQYDLEKIFISQRLSKLARFVNR